MAIKYSGTIINDRLTTVNTDIGTSAKLRIYNGTRPASVGTAVSTQTLLAELTCNATAFGTVASQQLTAGAITSANASATGTATWFRIFKSDGTTACVDGDVGTSGSDLNLNSTSITSGQSVSVTSCVINGQPV